MSLCQSPLATQGVTERNGLGGKALRVGEKKLSWVCSERWSLREEETPAAERTKSKSGKSVRAQEKMRESQPSVVPKRCLGFPDKGMEMTLKRRLTAGEKGLSWVYPQPVLLTTEPLFSPFSIFLPKSVTPENFVV